MTIKQSIEINLQNNLKFKLNSSIKRCQSENDSKDQQYSRG